MAALLFLQGNQKRAANKLLLLFFFQFKIKRALKLPALFISQRDYLFNFAL